MVKNKAFVDYPETNLKVTCVEGTKVYDLVAVSNHMGFVGGGHYTAYAKNGKTWYSFNDSFVDVLRSSVVTGDAYILVYMLSSISTSPETINGY